VPYITLAGWTAPRLVLATFVPRSYAVTAQRSLVVLRTRGLLAMALTALPSDCLLACLARVPYADLRNGIPGTCKSLRDAVTSAALRKTREAAGWTEWAVFAASINETANCYLITASGAYLTAPRPPVSNWHTERLTGASGDVVALFQPQDGSERETMRAHVYDPRRNRWSPIAPLDREFHGAAYSGFGVLVGVGSVGSRLYVLGGGFDDSDESLMAFDAYDVATGEWSSLPKLDFESVYTAAIEVEGKLWCYASQGLEGKIRIYDPETGLWTEGPDLPHELFGIDTGVTKHCNAFVREGRFCILAKFRGGEYVYAFHGEGNYSYRTFAWNPTSEEWDENPFPPPPECATRCSCIDDHLISFGSEPVEGVNFQNPHDLQDYQQGRTTRMYVLAPGDGARWIEWRLPGDSRRISTRVAAVRLG
jgi:hypothetical protein